MEGMLRDPNETEPEPSQPAESSTLTPEAIDAALEYVAARWPNHPFHAEQREAWGDVLAYLRPKELKPALATLASDYRPDPDKVLAAVHEARRPRHPEFKPEPLPEPDQDLNHRELDRIRAECNIPTWIRKP